MRYIWFAFTLSLLLACAPAKQIYKPSGADKAWEISGEFKDHTNELTIRINGAPVIKGTVDHRRGKDTLTGSYEGRAISTTCVSVANYLVPQEQCTVLVDGEQAAVLTF
jgi:hypothetical protein